ncbi:MAG: ABC transporter substrate-binding protein [Alphaproteobacteria bacterium]|nr:ABC transporter substrate-binding protein [Alphaproteobacteria bacterium]
MLRRDYLSRSLGLGTALAVGGMPGLVRAQTRPLTFTSWGGALSEAEKNAFTAPFAKLKNINVINTSPTETAKIKAMVQAKNVEWDVVTVGGSAAWLGQREGFLETLDLSKIPNAKDLEASWIAPTGVATSTGATIIAWSTRAFPANAGPQSWADFWDVKRFPGRRGLYTNFLYNYEAALRAAGVARTEVYPVTPEKIEIVFAKLAEIKPHVAVWWSAGAQPPQLLSTGELAMSSVWNGRALSAQADGAPLAFTYRDGIAWANWWVIPKGSPHVALAHELMNYALTEEAQTRLLPLKTYGPVLKAAAAKADAEGHKIQVMSPENLQSMVLQNEQEADKYSTANFERFTKLKVG